MESIRTLSFFSGCGGLDLGFHQAGFDLLYASDFEHIFCETLKANCEKHFQRAPKVECKDIRVIDIDTLPDDIDFIIGGPPCQTFSASGRRAGGASGQLDARGTLFQFYGKIISEKKPRGFLFENVRGILGSNGGRDWEDIKAYFTKLGYTLDFRVLDACDYGIPQHRERLILVGHHMEEPFLFPRPTYGPDSSSGQDHISIAKALEGVVHDENIQDLKLSGGKYSHLLDEIPPGDNYLYFTEKRGHPKPVFAYRSRFSDFLYKANPDTPTKTIIASPGKYTGPLHWENRYFSVSEYKRIQGFPDDYIICGKRPERIKQIGNSVSPKMAGALANAVKQQLFNHKSSANIELMEPDFLLSYDKRKGKKAQATRSKHLNVAKSNSLKAGKNAKFKTSSYTCTIAPLGFSNPSTKNVTVRVLKDRMIQMDVRTDSSRKLFAKMKLRLGLHGELTHLIPPESEELLMVNLYGESDFSIQTMWNAVDDWVIRSSYYHSLFEIYGHFTEPHPDFYIEEFKSYSERPICKFAEFAANFNNCSRFVTKDHLVEVFSPVMNIYSFVPLVEYLRGFRYDIRCKEINIAIPEDKYMIAYPFTLPSRKQMNFKITQLEYAQEAS